jgi:hypothetical protein
MSFCENQFLPLTAHAHSASNITPEQFDAACDRIDQLIDHTKATLSEKD